MKNPTLTHGKSPLSHFKNIDQLFFGCLDQCPKAQRALFDQLSPKMLALCMRYIKETAAAEDVLIIAFQKVFDRIGQFKLQGSFEGWIRRIVINECLMYLAKDRNLYKEIGLEKIYPAANHSGPCDILDWEDLEKMMHILPRGYRKVFELFVLKGWSHIEIAKQLLISENTSKSQLSRARMQLQKRFFQLS
jgi:RNA polymerase sigma factor (sigma-70 family)